MNGARSWALVAIGVLLSGVISVLTPAWASAREPGLDRASNRVVAAMVRDLAWSNPPRCQVARLSRSDSSWAYFALKRSLPAGCGAYDGYSVLRKTNGMWRSVPLGGSGSRDCSELKRLYLTEGASPSVFQDFKAAGVCTPGL